MVIQLFLKVLLYNVLHKGSIGSINVLIMNFRFKFSFHHCISRRFCMKVTRVRLFSNQKTHFRMGIFSRRHEINFRFTNMAVFVILILVSKYLAEFLLSHLWKLVLYGVHRKISLFWNNSLTEKTRIVNKYLTIVKLLCTVILEWFQRY